MKNTLLTLLILFTMSFTACKPASSPQYAVNAEQLWIERDGGKKVCCVLYRPDGVEKGPLVVFSHGFGATHQSGALFGERFARLGCFVVTFDFCGGSNYSESDGATTEMTLGSEVADLLAVIGHFSKQEFADPERVFLIGESQGGMVTALATGENPALARQIALIYPAFCIQEDWVRRYPVRDSVPEVMDLWGTKLGRGFVEELYGLDVWGTIAHYAKPVLILHGDADPVVSIAFSEKAMAVYPDARLNVYPGEGHGFTAEGQQAAFNQIREFFLGK